MSGADRISSLPDSLVIHLMSFLKTREAVQTCILSKRWRNLWAYLPCLDFNCKDFNDDEAIKFERFVSSVLLLRKTSHLDTFRLKWCYYPDYEEDEDIETRNVDIARTWVLHALECKPRVLSIEVFGYYPKDLPNSALTRASLEEMSLRFHDMTRVFRPTFVNLPCLKRLSLSWITIDDGFVQLVSRCPVLEELYLCYCYLDLVGFYSHTLKYLNIEYSHFRTTFTVSIPSLVSLRLNASSEKFSLSFTNMSSLQKACISERSDCDGSKSNFEPNILNGLSNVTDLELDGRIMEDLLKKGLPNYPTFCNLRRLSLGKWCMSEHFDLISHLLQRSPNLEKLTLHHIPDIVEHTEEGARDRSPSSNMKFRCEHLKTIEIKFSEEASNVHKLVKLLLENMVTTKGVEIKLLGC